MSRSAEDLLERVRRFALPEGDVEPREVRFKQEGEMRLSPSARWKPFRAEQWMSAAAIDFRWRAWFRMASFAPVRVVDAFEGGRGRLRALGFGVLPLFRGEGPDFDRGEAMRALAELPWRPYAFGVIPHVRFTAARQNVLLATFEDGRTRAEVEMTIDDEGRVAGASAIRPRAEGKRIVDTQWTGSFGDYRRFGRVRVPASAEVAWILPEGPFAYWRGRITGFPEL
jgi:hypothetical protein